LGKRNSFTAGCGEPEEIVMVDINLTIGNEDIPVVRGWVEAQKAELLKGMVAGQPTRKTAAATLLYSIVGRIEGQLDEHAARCKAKDEQDRAARQGNQ
jgi:hypothetical protein